ncbi:MAG TPA: GNAT family N-acetyltransferase, partial [Nordella sp.]|nr:GNAT family N-acetyltransferase [Nordella sp.]
MWVICRPHLKLPKVFVMPDMRLDGAVARMLSATTESRGLPLVITGQFERPFLESELEGEQYLKDALGNRHYKEFRRLGRRLAEMGAVEHKVARAQDDVRHAIEQFLTLEASGWKGR